MRSKEVSDTPVYLLTGQYISINDLLMRAIKDPVLKDQIVNDVYDLFVALLSFKPNRLQRMTRPFLVRKPVVPKPEQFWDMTRELLGVKALNDDELARLSPDLLNDPAYSFRLHEIGRRWGVKIRHIDGSKVASSEDDAAEVDETPDVLDSSNHR